MRRYTGDNKVAISTTRLISGPAISFENLIECRMRDDVVLVHRAADSLRNLREIDATVDESFNGNFVGGVENGGERAADFAGFARELK